MGVGFYLPPVHAAITIAVAVAIALALALALESVGLIPTESESKRNQHPPTTHTEHTAETLFLSLTPKIGVARISLLSFDIFKIFLAVLYCKNESFMRESPPAFCIGMHPFCNAVGQREKEKRATCII